MIVRTLLKYPHFFLALPVPKGGGIRDFSRFWSISSSSQQWVKGSVKCQQANLRELRVTCTEDDLFFRRMMQIETDDETADDMAENMTWRLPQSPLSGGLCLYKRHNKNVLFHWSGWCFPTAFGPAHFCTLNTGQAPWALVPSAGVKSMSTANPSSLQPRPSVNLFSEREKAAELQFWLCEDPPWLGTIWQLTKAYNMIKQKGTQGFFIQQQLPSDRRSQT